jgi:hypothetical protein
MPTLLAQAAAKPAGGAPLEQIAVVAVSTTVITLAVLLLVARYRTGHARPLRAAGAAAERVLGVPAWAGVPAVLGIAFGVVALFGVTWDVSLHVDQGRDEGPLGTGAHYPILVGLLGLFQAGLLAVGMAPASRRDASRTSLRIRGLWPVPLAAALMLVASSLAFLGFPLDDLWHRLFGQDVTIWGPTHVQMIACAIIGVIGALLLLVEGARTAGRDLQHPRGVVLRPLPVAFGTVTLAGWVVLLAEYDLGVPQYRMVWHPLILAFAATQALVLARLWGGRGAALAATLVYVPVLAVFSWIVGQPLGLTHPSMPLFVVEALVVEGAALALGTRRPMRFAVAAAALVGTVGFAAEYAWSHVAMPLPWTPSLLAEGVPVALLGALAGAVVSVVFVQALLGRSAPGRRPVLLASGAGVLAVALGVNALVVSNPAGGVTARIQVSDVRPTAGPGGTPTQPTGRVRVTFDPPSIARDAHWVQAMGWQGGASFVDRLTRQPDGSWTSSERVPLTGNWKSVVRVHRGRAMLAAPIFMPADDAIDFAGVPVRPDAARAMVYDHELLQVERKDDVPTWLWNPAIIAVLSIVALLLVGTGLAAGRLGRAAARGAATAPTGPGLLAELVGGVLERVTHRRPPASGATGD